jgi:hypothetical protein
MIRN